MRFVIASCEPVDLEAPLAGWRRAARAGATAHASAHVQRDLGNLAASTLLVHELCLRQLIGRDRLLALAEEWLGSTMPPQLNVGLKAAAGTTRGLAQEPGLGRPLVTPPGRRPAGL